MKKVNGINKNAKMSASSFWIMGIFFLGLKRKAHYPREATLVAKNRNMPVGATTVSAHAITLIAFAISRKCVRYEERA